VSADGEQRAPRLSNSEATKAAGDGPDRRRGGPHEESREARSAAVVAAAILSSKLVGLVRQRVTAHFFGTSAVADVIAAAFRAGNLAQNLLGEGALSASFIPVYAKLRAEGRDAEAVAFAQAAFGLLFATVVVLSGLGVALAPWLAIAVAGGFDAAKLSMTSRLIRIVFPATGLLVMCAWSLGVLNTHRKFFLPYAAPIIWSAAQIAALFIGGAWLMLSGEALARTLAAGALGGAALELGTLLSRTRPLLGRLKPSFDHNNPHLREAAQRLPGVLVGRGVIQISGLVDTLLVSFVGTGAAATFVYAQMLYLLPMSLLGTGEAAVSLPEMARDTAEGDISARHALLRRRLGTTLTRVSVLGIGAMVVLMVFGIELISVLLRTGRFDAESTARVAAALRVYGIALIGNASVRLFSTTFFALGDTRLPARYAVVRVVLSTLVSLALMGPFGVVGVVAGAVTAAWAEALLLGLQLRKKIDGLGLDALPLARMLGLAAVTTAIPYGVKYLLGPRSTTLWGGLLVLGTAGATYLVAVTALRLLDVRQLLRRG
jgi:putative peptidoglycan lipid II flippase